MSFVNSVIYLNKILDKSITIYDIIIMYIICVCVCVCVRACVRVCVRVCACVPVMFITTPIVSGFFNKIGGYH